MADPFSGWTLDPGMLTLTGRSLRRPECVLHDRNHDLWIADLAGMVQLTPDGQEIRLTARDGSGGPYAQDGTGVDGVDISANAGISLPNGMCFDGDEGFVIANFGTNVIEWLGRDGSYRLILDSIDGAPLGKCNFPVIDRSGRIWFSVTASTEDWKTGRRGATSGYVAVIDEGGARIVARDLVGTNELRFDEKEEWLYVAETGADHLTRFRVGPNATLSDREVYGPERLGGAPDGFAFDTAGNIWTTLIAVDRLVVLTPGGEVITVWQDADLTKREGPLRSLGAQPGDGLAPRMASVTFGGADMRTVYVGSLVGTSLPTFTAPIAGRPVPRGRWTRRPAQTTAASE